MASEKEAKSRRHRYCSNKCSSFHMHAELLGFGDSKRVCNNDSNSSIQTANASHREKQKLCQWFYFINKLLLFIPV